MTGGRCPWADASEAMRRYHDEEWGLALHDDRGLFELLTLEGAQAGLSWATVLARRDAYRRAFHGFDIARVASYGDADVERLLAPESGIIRNRAKVLATIANARAALAVVREYGSLDAFLWGLAGGSPLQNAWQSLSQLPAETEQSRAMSRELRRRGFGFVGPTVCYAFMQATGMVNDHLVSCVRHAEVQAKA
jgi:DNA-3-methyladenine glycosylase I